MLTLITCCPCCNETDHIELTDEETANYIRWRNRELLIQEAFPNRTPSEREQLKTGICPKCWKEMFGDD